MSEAIDAEKGNSLVTCKAIVKETMYSGLDEFVEEYADEKEKSK